MARIKNKQRSDGRLQAKVSLGSVDGKPKYKYVYASSQKELDAKIAEVKLQLGKGLDVAAQRDSFGEWAQRWLKLKKTEISDKKYKAYAAKEVYIRHLYSYQISKIRTQDIQDVIVDNPQLAEYTLKQIKGMCSQIMQLAVDNRVIDYNPAKAVKIPKKNVDIGEKRRALTEQEQQWITDTPHRAQTAAMIMMYAGLRRGELIPLLWKDIDLEAGTISVNKSAEAVDGKLVVKQGAKTVAGERTVYIPSKLVDYLKSVSRNNSMFVCPSSKGDMLTDSAWKRLWDSYISELNFKYGDFSQVLMPNKISGELEQYHKPKSRFAPEKIPIVIPHFTAHWLRHTYITMLYFAGVDVLTAKEQAGHSDINTTLAIYTHLDNQHKKRQINKLNDYLNGCQMGVSENSKQRNIG